MSDFEVHPVNSFAAMTSELLPSLRATARLQNETIVELRAELDSVREQIAQNRAANRENAAMLEQWRVWSWKVLQDLMRLGHHKDVLRKELRHASQALARISETHSEYRMDYEQAVKVLEETK